MSGQLIHYLSKLYLISWHHFSNQFQKKKKPNPYTRWHAVSEWSDCLPVQVMDCDTASFQKYKVHTKNRAEKKDILCLTACYL